MYENSEALIRALRIIVILMSVLEVQKLLNDCFDRCIESEA